MNQPEKTDTVGVREPRRRRRGRHVSRSSAPPRLQAGAGKRLITPPVGGPLIGLPERDLAGGSRAVHDDLYARALVISNGDLALALASVDLFAVPYALAEEIARGVSAETGVPQDHVILAASHTYSGPSVSKTIVGGEPDGDWVAVLKSEVVNAIRDAFASMRPARVGVKAGQCPVTLTGRIRLRESADHTSDADAVSDGGSIDRLADAELGVLRVADLRGRTVAILANFACQPLTVGRDGAFMISADFPGVFAARVESAFPGAVALFTNGAAADALPRLHTGNRGEASGGYRDTMLMGELLADEATRLAREIRPRQRVSLAVAKKRTVLPLDVKKAPAVRPKQGRSAFEAVSKFEKQLLAGGSSQELLDEAGAHYIADSRWVPAMAETLRRGKPPRQVEAALWACSIGSAALVTVPGELYSCSGAEVKRRSSFKHTFVLGYAGGYLGFLAPRVVCERGGWEVEEAHKFLPGPGLPLAAGTVEDALTDQMVSIVNSLSPRRARSASGSGS